MTIIWDDAGDGSVYDHNGDVIGTVGTSGYQFPDDIQTLLSKTWRDEANLGNSPIMTAYAGELLLQKVDSDIKRTSEEGVTVP